MSHYCRNWRLDDDFVPAIVNGINGTSYQSVKKTCQYCQTVFERENQYYGHMLTCTGSRRRIPPAQPTPPTLSAPPGRFTTPRTSPAIVPLPPSPPLTEVSSTPVHGSFAQPLDQWVRTKAAVTEVEVERRLAELRQVLETEHAAKAAVEIEKRVSELRTILDAEFAVKKSREEERCRERVESNRLECVTRIKELNARHAKEMSELREELACDNPATAQHEQDKAELIKKHKEEIAAIEAIAKAAQEDFNAQLEELERQVDELDLSDNATIAKSVAGESAACTPPSRGYRALYTAKHDDSVTIKVGSAGDHETFHMDRSYLVGVSAIFERQLSSDSAPHFTILHQNITITNCTPAVFKVFRDWIFARRLPARFKPLPASNGDAQESKQIHVELIHVYVFAHTYNIPQLRRDVLEAYMKLCVEGNQVPSMGLLAAAHALLPFNSPVLRFMADAYAYMWNGKLCTTEKEEWDSLPIHFFRRVAEKRARNVAHRFAVCDYHEH